MSGFVAADVHNKNLKIFADGLIVKQKDGRFLSKAFPGRLGPTVSPMTPKTGPERLAFYTMITDPGDFALIIDPIYLYKQKRGLAPNPISPYWANLLSLPWAFERYRQDFINLFRAANKQIMQVAP